MSVHAFVGVSLYRCRRLNVQQSSIPIEDNSGIRWSFSICCIHPSPSLSLSVPAGSPSPGGNVTVYVFNINQPSLPAPFYSVLVSVSVFMALQPVFHSIILPTTLRILTLFFWSSFCLIGSFNYISLSKSLPKWFQSPAVGSCGRIN